MPTVAKSTQPTKPAPVETPPQPTSFHDSIALRARNVRFRGIGNPFAFLAEIGIVPIKEYIYRGATIIDLAETLNLPVTTLRTWIEENGYQGEVEEASTLSAEGYIRQGEIMLRSAANKFDLDKAKAMIEHGRWMASKKDKKTYGTQPGELGGPAAVSYVFQIGDNSAVQVNTQAPADPKSLNNTQDEQKPVEFSLGETNPFLIERPPEHLRQVHSNYPAIAPLSDDIIDGDIV